MNYKQYDTRWATLGYPWKPWVIRNCGCGCAAVTNAIIEMASQEHQTIKTTQPYMKRYAEAHGNGTYHYGVPASMAYYGLTEVYEHSTMQKLFNELAKGNRIAILLMGSRNAGSKGVHWTGSGHFVAVTGYKKENGKNWLYVKDSASTSSLRNGWITYEDNVRGACLKCWSGKLDMSKLVVDGYGGANTVKRLQEFLGVAKTGKLTIKKDLYQYCESWNAITFGDTDPTVKTMQKWLGIAQSGRWDKSTSLALQKRLNIKQDGYFGQNSMKSLQIYLNMRDKAVFPAVKPATAPTRFDKANTWARMIANDSRYEYVHYSDAEWTHECPICHPRNHDLGWNCIGFATACWRHGAGIPCRCNCETINNSMGERILRSNHETAVKLVQGCLGITQVNVISNAGKPIPMDKLKQGDLLLLFDGDEYYHMVYYMGKGLMADSSSGRSDNIKADVVMTNAVRADIKIAIRYTGK